MKKLSFLFLGLLPFVLFAQFATISQIDPIKNIGRTHRVNIYTNTKNEISERLRKENEQIIAFSEKLLGQKIILKSG